MIEVNLRSHIKNTTPEELFEELSDRERLQELMPRMRKIEYGEQNVNSQDIVMHIGIGGGFGTIRCEGTLTWDEPQSLTFKVTSPLPVETVWEFTPAINGTEITISMSLDLFPMLGPMASFVPRNLVEELMIKETKQAINQVARRVKERARREQAIAA